MGIVATFAGVRRLHAVVRQECYEYVGTERERLAEVWTSFEQRRRDLPSIIMFGGSDVREAYDDAQAEQFLRTKGYQFFNFGKSATNPILEEYQMASTLPLAVHDVLFFNVQPRDFNTNEAPSHSERYESFFAYIHRIQWGFAKPSPSLFVDRAMRQLFAWFRDRETLRECAFNRLEKKRPFRRYKYGDGPEQGYIRAAKVKEFEIKKIDAGMELSTSLENVRLMTESLIDIRKKGRAVVVVTPRNPTYSLIETDSYIAAHNQLVDEMFHAVHLAHFVELTNADFYDFNHLHKFGRKKFTAKILPKLMTLANTANGAP